jgi:putative SOS response-associated peptidase YedK
MCGRYELHTLFDDLRDYFQITEAPFTPKARYNIAPTQTVAAVLRTDSGSRSLVGLSWGLIPAWSKEPNPKVRPINAKAETLTEKPMFKRPVQSKRCLILASGFYEWRKDPDGKTPIYFRRRDERPFAFAGIWDEWKGGDGEPLRSCCIITVPPNTLVAPVHDRMPAMLRREDEAAWLEGDTQAALSVLRAYPESEMEGFAVSRRVNSPRNDEPSLIVRGDSG